MKMSALSAPGWFVAVMLLHCGLLLVFVGEAVRDAFDPRKAFSD